MSPYGTMEQGGYAYEWAESGGSAPNDDASESRVLRGGAWSFPPDYLEASGRYGDSPSLEIDALGCPVASVSAVPEPSGLLATGTVLGGSVLVRCRRGKRQHVRRQAPKPRAASLQQ